MPRLTAEERDQIQRESYARTMQRLYDELSDSTRSLIDQLVACHQSLVPYADLPGPEFRLLPEAIELGRLHDLLFSEPTSECLYMLYRHRCG